MYSSVSIFFDHIYESVSSYHVYKPEWQNQPNNRALVEFLGLLSEGASTTSVDPQGRRMIVVGTVLGNIVLSENVPGCKDGVVYCDMPKEYHFLFHIDRVLTAEQFRTVYDPTMKTTLVDRMKDLKKARERPPREHSEQP